MPAALSRHVLTNGSDSPKPIRSSEPVGFSVKVKRDGQFATLIPAGEIDLATVEQLQSELETLIDADCTRIVIDLREVEFLDSTGLQALVRAHARAEQDRWELAIIPGPRAVQRVFEITGVIDHLRFVTADDAAAGGDVAASAPETCSGTS
jgi:anti-sigma B factor antagonist